MTKKIPVGGQAIIEGVMMRSPKSLAIAVRRADGRIILKESEWKSIWDKLKFFKWPFFRGTVVLIEAMINGISALNFSASQAMKDEEIEENKNKDAVKDNAKTDESVKNKSEKEPGKWTMGFSMLLGVLFAILLFKMLPHLIATWYGTYILGRELTVDNISYHVIDGIVKIVIFIGYVAVIGLSGEIRKIFMYHGAEHAAIYTYEAGEDLIPENAEKKSRLHPRCGTAFIMVVLLIFIAVAAFLMPYIPQWAKPGENTGWYRHIYVVMFKLPLLIPVAGIAYEFNRFAGKHSDNPILKNFLLPGLGMQLLTTREPDKSQLEVALASLRATLARETNGFPKDSKELISEYESFDKLNF